jgi:hypothetical protein
MSKNFLCYDREIEDFFIVEAKSREKAEKIAYDNKAMIL